MNARIEEILKTKARMPFYDTELWDFMDRVRGRNLQNLATDKLVERLQLIEKNIQYLDASLLIAPEGRADDGWKSFAWWLRARHWTLREIDVRELSVEASPIIEASPVATEQIKNATLGDGILARVGNQKYLSMYMHGNLRFTQAKAYEDSALGAARSDDEMSKGRMRPAQSLTITSADGRVISAIKDVRFSRNRAIEINGALVPRPYLFCSFSNEIDPRLVTEFPGSNGILVVFDVNEFMRRSFLHLEAVLPDVRKGLVINEYYDPYYVAADSLGAVKSKELGYAYQREVRYVIDPGEKVELAAEVYETKATTFADIAALYDPNGLKIEGTGPDRLFVD